MLYVFEKGERLRSGCFPSSAQGLFALLRRRSWVSKGRRRAMAISRSLMSQRIGCGGELKCAHTRERERERDRERKDGRGVDLESAQITWINECIEQGTGSGALSLRWRRR